MELEILANQTKYYLPTTNAKPQIDEFVYFVINITGGGTLHPPSRGLWVHEGITYDESVCIFETYSNMTDEEAADIVEAFYKFGRETKQHSIALVTANKMIVLEVDA